MLSPQQPLRGLLGGAPSGLTPTSMSRTRIHARGLARRQISSHKSSQRRSQHHANPHTSRRQHHSLRRRSRKYAKAYAEGANGSARLRNRKGLPGLGLYPGPTPSSLPRVNCLTSVSSVDVISCTFARTFFPTLARTMMPYCGAGRRYRPACSRKDSTSRHDDHRR
jgi:hypothetical protein